MKGTVTQVDSAGCDSPSTGRAFSDSPQIPAASSNVKCSRALVDIPSGDSKGLRTQLVTYGQPGEPELATGDKILLVETPGDGGSSFTFGDYQRGTALLIWAAILVIAMAIFAYWRGIFALGGLVIALGIVGVFLLPGLARGGDPVSLAIVCGAAILIVVVPLVHGINWKAGAALAGTLVALLVAAFLSALATSTTHLRGLGHEENLNTLRYLPDVSISGLMLCGFIIGTLGVLNDVTISQASTINELAELDEAATPWRLFRSAMIVGRDHISSMIYTLVLSYTGAALPMLLLLSVANRPLMDTLTSDVMASELLRSGVGALTLTLAVPITTLIAAGQYQPLVKDCGPKPEYSTRHFSNYPLGGCFCRR